MPGFPIVEGQVLRSISLLLTRGLLYCGGWVAGLRQVSSVAQENRRPLQLIIDYCPCFRRDDNIIDYFSEFSLPSIDFAQDGVCGPESVLIPVRLRSEPALSLSNGAGCGLASFGSGFKGGTEGAE